MATESIKMLAASIIELVSASRNEILQRVNSTVVITNFEIGRLIVENEQKGEQRAEYGKETLNKLSADLTKEFGRGYSVDNLELKRKFFILYQGRISESLIRKSYPNNKTTDNQLVNNQYQKSETLSRIFKIRNDLFPLSWTHYVQLMKMDDRERNFYEIV